MQVEDKLLVETTQFSCPRLGAVTQIDIHYALRPLGEGALPALSVRVMECHNKDNCGIATICADGIPRYAWPLCPASEIFKLKGTFRD